MKPNECKHIYKNRLCWLRVYYGGIDGRSLCAKPCVLCEDNVDTCHLFIFKHKPMECKYFNEQHCAFDGESCALLSSTGYCKLFTSKSISL